MIKIELSAEQWNSILSILATQRFDQVALLIQSIQQQAQGQITQPDDDGVGGA